MRTAIAGAAMLAALAMSSARAVPVLDTGGFEGYAYGNIVGQNGWQRAGMPISNPAWAVKDPEIVDGPAGSGKTLGFSNIEKAQGAVQVNFANLTGTYQYARASFDFFREDAAIYNNLDWWPVGSNPWYGMGWDAGAVPPGVVAPFGDTSKGTVPQIPGTWEHIDVLFDLVNGKGTGWVNGALVSNNVNIGTGEFAGWYFDDWQTVDQGRTPGATGRKVYLDNLYIVAGNTANEVPEPSSLALLGTAFLPLLGLRRRKA